MKASRSLIRSKLLIRGLSHFPGIKNLEEKRVFTGNSIEELMESISSDSVYDFLDYGKTTFAIILTDDERKLIRGGL